LIITQIKTRDRPFRRPPAALRQLIQHTGGMPQRFVWYYYQPLASPPRWWDSNLAPSFSGMDKYSITYNLGNVNSHPSHLGIITRHLTEL